MRAHPVASLYLDHLLKGPRSKRAHTRRSWKFALQDVNWGVGWGAPGRNSARKRGFGTLGHLCPLLQGSRQQPLGHLRPRCSPRYGRLSTVGPASAFLTTPTTQGHPPLSLDNRGGLRHCHTSLRQGRSHCRSEPALGTCLRPPALSECL